MLAGGNPRCVSAHGPAPTVGDSSACAHRPLVTAQRESQAAWDKPTLGDLKIQSPLRISYALVHWVAHAFIYIDFIRSTTVSTGERGTSPVTYMTPHKLQAWFLSVLFQWKSEATPRHKKGLHKIRFSPYVRMLNPCLSNAFLFWGCKFSSFKLLVGSASLCSHLPTQHSTPLCLQLAGLSLNTYRKS